MACLRRFRIPYKKATILFSTTVLAVPAIKNVQDIKIVNEGKPNVEQEIKKVIGWDGVKRMYSKDEYGELSMELCAVLQSTYIAVFFGTIYGVCQNTREAYRNFIEKNQASMFTDEFEARRKLQDKVTIAGFKGMFKYGLKLGGYTGFMVMGTITLLVYYGHSSIFHYVIPGAVFGAVYRWKLGPAGMFAGSIVGSTLGLIAGLTTKGMFAISGTTIEDIILYNAKSYIDHKKVYRNAVLKSMESDASPTANQALEEHADFIKEYEEMNLKKQKEEKTENENIKK